MGMVPPRFHSCHARYNPTRNYLQLEADMAFKSSGFQLVVRFKLFVLQPQAGSAQLHPLYPVRSSACSIASFLLKPS